MEFDDRYGLVTLFFINGAWGLTAAGIFSNPIYADKITPSFNCGGALFPSSGGAFQLAANAIYGLTIVVFVGAVNFALQMFIRYFGALKNRLIKLISRPPAEI